MRMRLAFAAALAALAAMRVAADVAVISARMRTEPETPYMGEDFSFILAVTAESGGDIELAGISGLPTSLPIVAEPFVSGGVRDGAKAGGAQERIHTFTAAARATRAFSFNPRAMVSLKVTERKGGGFFTSWSTRNRTMPLAWSYFSARELPEEGRPADFNGAVGRFKLSLEAEPREVMPQDIVQLRLTLSGTGHLGDAVPSMPTLDPSLFKTYPPVVKREEGDARLTITQSVIPLSTNAVEIGAASLAFFDAARGAYTNALTAPVRLLFRERGAASAPAVREVRVDTPTRTVSDEGLDVSKFISLPRGKSSVAIARETQLRIAPGPQAKTILAVPAGSAAVPLEAERGWLRVKVLDRTGWLPAQDIE